MFFVLFHVADHVCVLWKNRDTMAFSEFAIYAVFWNGMASIEWKWLNLQYDGGIRDI